MCFSAQLTKSRSEQGGGTDSSQALLCACPTEQKCQHLYFNLVDIKQGWCGWSGRGGRHHTRCGLVCLNVVGGGGGGCSEVFHRGGTISHNRIHNSNISLDHEHNLNFGLEGGPVGPAGYIFVFLRWSCGNVGSSVREPPCQTPHGSEVH